MIDDSATILTYLLSRAELTALVGSRIWAESNTPPADQYKPSDGPGICFKRRGGGFDYEAVNLFPSYQFKIYGADGAAGQTTSPEASANQVYRTLFDIFNYHSEYLIKSAELEAQGQTLFEPDTRWLYVLCFYKVQVLN